MRYRTKKRTPPAPDVFELSLFGPGFGESVAVHCGQGEWVIVDSFLDKFSEEPAALTYLESIGIDPAKAIKLIVASHWHEDHVRGISTLARASPASRIAFSSILRGEEFRKLAYLAAEDFPDSSPLAEFAEIFDLDPRRLVLASANQVLFRLGNLEIWALSPTSGAQVRGIKELAHLLPVLKDRKKRLITRGANHLAVALSISVGKEPYVLLGSDLEESPTGWSAVLKDPLRRAGKSAWFKVPHHGSDNAHHASVWSEMLQPNPISVVAPFSRGVKPLPAHSDIVRIKALTSELHTSAPSGTRRPPPRKPEVEKELAGIVRSRVALQHRTGHVRVRRRLDARGTFEVRHFNGAERF